MRDLIGVHEDSWIPGLLVRLRRPSVGIVGAGVSPAHQSRSGLHRVSERSWGAQVPRTLPLPFPISWLPGLLVRLWRPSGGVVGAGVPPARQSRSGMHRVSERSWGAQVRRNAPAAVPDFLRAPAFWSAFGDPASSHRRGRSGGGFEGLRPRRWHAGGLPRRREPGAVAPPGGARYDIVRGASRRRVATPAQCQTRHARGRPLSRVTSRSPFRVEKAPGESADFVEETDCRIGLR